MFILFSLNIANFKEINENEASKYTNKAKFTQFNETSYVKLSNISANH